MNMNPPNARLTNNARIRSRSANDDGDTVRPSIETLLKAQRHDRGVRSPLMMKRTSAARSYALPSHPIYEMEDEETKMNRVPLTQYTSPRQNGYRSRRRHTTDTYKHSPFNVNHMHQGHGDNMTSLNEVLHQLRLIVLPLQKEISSLRLVTRDLQQQVDILRFENKRLQQVNEAKTTGKGTPIGRVRRAKSKNQLWINLNNKTPVLKETYSTDDDMKMNENDLQFEMDELTRDCSIDTMIAMTSLVTDDDSHSVNTASLFSENLKMSRHGSARS